MLCTDSTTVPLSLAAPGIFLSEGVYFPTLLCLKSITVIRVSLYNLSSEQFRNPISAVPLLCPLFVQ